MLNFRGNQESFSTFSLIEALNNSIPSDSLHDRLVIIGTSAVSLKDFFLTPYNSGLLNSSPRMPGVVLHANITSQILSASLDRRPLIRTLEEPLEWIWIIAWAGLGVVIIWQFKSTNTIALSLLFTSGGLVGICYLAFVVLGWWLPVMPSLFSLFNGGDYFVGHDE